MTGNGKTHMRPLPEKQFERASIARDIDLPGVFYRADVFEGQDSTMYQVGNTGERYVI